MIFVVHLKSINGNKHNFSYNNNNNGGFLYSAHVRHIVRDAPGAAPMITLVLVTCMW